MARLQGVPARICTWELVTGFGQNPTGDELAECFRRDFPEMGRLPKFWKMVSFNSSEGRRHRYLAILADQEELPGGRLLCGRRVLPRSLFLYARADEQMRSWERYENFRYAAIVDGTLHVLVFYEGRLCHWSEERGYGGPGGKALALKRLENMDEFLKHDPLFSKAESFRCGGLDTLAVDFDNPVGEWLAPFRQAAVDPFWKGLHLEQERRADRTTLFIILLLMMMVAGAFVWMRLDAGCGVMPGPDAPTLTPPATGPISNEPRFGDVVKFYRPQNAAPAPECTKPALEIHGIVERRLFSGLLDGQPVMKKTGDSLDLYRVKSVLRDRVVLECGDKEWEVVNGAP